MIGRNRRTIVGAVIGALTGGAATTATGSDSSESKYTREITLDEEYGSWWYELGSADDGGRYWQIIGRLWNPDILREEYRLRRPLVDDATPDRLVTDEWEVKMVKGSSLGMSYQALEYRGDEGRKKAEELTEKYGDASSIDAL